ncbi:MAG: cytochrome c-type biogenesis protein CcmH [Cypionkella sp.]|nr:cytochrome c-type biogenesis protein CcmH [Cypionkella sp.]
MFIRALTLAAALALSPALPLLAVQPDEILSDPALEARARAISRELRCPVCQGEAIDDSNAPVSRDLRLLVRERLLEGDSDEEVLDFIVARYGEFVLFNPRPEGANLLLWAAGPILLLLGGGLAFAYTRRRADAVAAGEAALTPEEEARLKDLV